MGEITGGELLIRCLHAERVRFIHAITDGTYMMVLEALERLGPQINMQLIVPRHEAAAAHACDAFTRITSEPAVVMACAGPGAANLIAGLMCAQAEGSPVVAITTPRRSAHPKIAELRSVQDDWRRQLDEDVADMQRDPMLTGQILKACNDFFPPDAIFVMDGGNTTLWSIHYHIARSQRSVIYSMNYGHLGTGLPYALGAKLARPDRDVYCVTGDSAFGFNLQELETAVRHQLAVIVIVAVDGAYGMEKTAQQRMFGRRADWFGHEHAPVRYDQVAMAMGCHGEYVSKGCELKPALERARAAGKPAVIHATVDPVANVDPPGTWLWVAARTGKLEM